MSELIDPETCSWCLNEYEWEDLTETNDGNLCNHCLNNCGQDKLDQLFA